VSTTPPRTGSGTQLPPLFTKREAYALGILSIAFILVSVLIHGVVGTWAESMLPHFKAEATPPPQKVIVQTLIKPPPKPTPTPRPTPTPTPPPPLKNTPPPVALKLHVLQTKSNDTSGTGPVENAYTPPPVGNENGAPTAVPTVAPTEAPTEAPTPSGPIEATDASFLPGGKVEPEYPDMARDQNIQGDVTIRITIDATGAVIDAEVSSSSGSSLLDDAALKAAKASKFRPYLVNGVPQKQDYLIVYTFDLND